MKTELVELDAKQITIPARLKREEGDLQVLADSIRRVGLLFPLLVSRDNVLLSGYRRLLACRQAGLNRVPALRMDAPAESMAALDIHSDENLCRKQLTSDEVDRAIARKRSLAAGESASSGSNSLLKRSRRLNPFRRGKKD